MPYPVVLKADGLAAGKGVSIVSTPKEAESELKSMLEGKFDDAGKKVVIEEFLKGEELSLLLIVEGKNVRAMEFSQDHKAALDGDLGPNTGGMGAYTPVSFADSALYDKVNKIVTTPLLDGFLEEDIDYRGVLYIGLMIVDEKPYVLEYNVRFGDPETEAVLFNMESDLVPYLEATAERKLDKTPNIDWNSGYAATVVMASGGYPGSYEKNIPIKGLDNVDEDAFVFHAGTAADEKGAFLTKGGRVLMVTAKGETISKALENAYANVDKIEFRDAFYRKDIGHREVKRENS